MISVQEAISRFRRDGAMSSILKGVMMTAVVITLSLHFFPLGKVLDPTLLLMILGFVWLSLWYRTMKGSRMAAESTSLIATGNLDLAEQQIEESLRAFSMSRSVKSMSLLNLAVVRTAQNRWPDAALLCREVLSVPQTAPDQVAKLGRLVLADALMEMGDLRGTHEAIQGLYDHRLTLNEALNLLRVQTEYLFRIGAWDQLFGNAATKVEMAELMPANQAARVQAYMALAAKKLGKSQWENWLKSRVELLVDVKEMTDKRPALLELWQTNG